MQWQFVKSNLNFIIVRLIPCSSTYTYRYTTYNLVDLFLSPQKWSYTGLHRIAQLMFIKVVCLLQVCDGIIYCHGRISPFLPFKQKSQHVSYSLKQMMYSVLQLLNYSRFLPYIVYIVIMLQGISALFQEPKLRDDFLLNPRFLRSLLTQLS